MADPGQTAQGNRTGQMLRYRSHPLRISPMLWVFSACLAGLASCSDGESGLVLGRPLPQPFAGNESAGGGGFGQAGQGGEPGSGKGGGPPVEPTAGVGGDGGSAGESGLEPPWVEELCTPPLTFANESPTGDGQAFDDVVPNPSIPMWEATRAVCRTLFRSASEVRSVPELSLTVGALESGPAATIGTSRIVLSAAYLRMQADAGNDLLPEISGILHFQASFLYQNAGSTQDDSSVTSWIRYGIADYVRLRGGYLDRAGRTAPTQPWHMSSSQTVAFFFDYLAERNPDVVYELNRHLAPDAAAWTDDTFLSLMAEDLPTLWDQYRATF